MHFIQKLQCFPHVYFTWVGRPGILTAAQVYIGNHFEITIMFLSITENNSGSIYYWTICPCSTPLYCHSHMLCRKTARVKHRYVLWSNILPVNTLIGICQWFIQACQCTRFMQRVSIGNKTDDKLSPHVAHLLLWKWNQHLNIPKREVCFFEQLHKTYCWPRTSTDTGSYWQRETERRGNVCALRRTIYTTLTLCRQTFKTTSNKIFWVSFSYQQICHTHTHTYCHSVGNWSIKICLCQIYNFYVLLIWWKQHFNPVQLSGTCPLTIVLWSSHFLWWPTLS